MAALSLTQVRKSFGKRAILHAIDLDVANGEFVVLVGPSGCGKTTTLRIIAGLDEMDSGEVRIGGRDVGGLEPKARNIAMVFQNYAIYPHMSVRRNIGFGLRTAGLDRTERNRRIEATAHLLGLAEQLDRRPDQLSGGQRQRVAIGRAMVRNPAVFLFDEPLSNLDAQLRGEMRLEIKKLHQRLGATIVFVTHDQVEAMTLADRIVVMRGGCIMQVGTPTELYDHPANLFTAGFIGSPPMNFLGGCVAEIPVGRAVDLDGIGRIDWPMQRTLRDSAGRRIVLGVRPEDITLGAPDAAAGLVLAGEIVALEPLGAETLVHVACGAANVVCRVGGRRVLRVGQRVDLHAAAETLHLFDAVTEQAMVPA